MLERLLLMRIVLKLRSAVRVIRRYLLFDLDQRVEVAAECNEPYLNDREHQKDAPNFHDGGGGFLSLSAYLFSLS